MTTRTKTREDGPIHLDDVDEVLDEIDGTESYLKAVSKRQDNPRWVTPVADGFRWLTPAEGRRHTTGRGDTRTTLRYYDTLTVVPEGDVPASVQKMGQGLSAFSDGGIAEP